MLSPTLKWADGWQKPCMPASREWHSYGLSQARQPNPRLALELHLLSLDVRCSCAERDEPSSRMCAVQGLESSWQLIAWSSATTWGLDAPPQWRWAVRSPVLPPRLCKFLQPLKRYTITCAPSARRPARYLQALNAPSEASDKTTWTCAARPRACCLQESTLLWHGLIGLGRMQPALSRALPGRG